METSEGKHLPVPHCIKGTHGWEIRKEIAEALSKADASCCAGVTPESHEAALLTMKMCQIEIV